MGKQTVKENLIEEDEPNLDVFFWQGVCTLEIDEYVKAILGGKLPSGPGDKVIEISFYLKMVSKGGGEAYI